MKKLAKILVLLFVLTIAVTCLVACGCKHTVDEYGYCTECDAKLVSENATYGLKYAIDRDSEGNRYAYVTGYVGDNTDITISNIYDGLPVKKYNLRIVVTVVKLIIEIKSPLSLFQIA